MLYFKIGTIIVAAIGLLIYALLYDRKYFFGLLIVEIICTGFLSFYIFYQIGSYTSTSSDIILKTNSTGDDSGLYSVDINIKWEIRPEIFGFDGDNDMLVVRYDPELLKIVWASKRYIEDKQGSSLLKLSKDYNYAKIEKNESEIGFRVKDGVDDAINLTFERIEAGGTIKVFFIHDYKVPLDSQVFWEKTGVIKLE